MPTTEAPVTLLTVPEVAARLKCSRPHVYRLIASDQLKAIDISAKGSARSKTRIKETDLNTYIEKATYT